MLLSIGVYLWSPFHWPDVGTAAVAVLWYPEHQEASILLKVTMIPVGPRITASRISCWCAD